MDAHAFRHFYEHHFAENRKMWEYVTQLPHKQFTHYVDYSQGSVRDQIVHVEHIEPSFYLVWLNDERFLTGEFFNHFHDDHEPNIRARLTRTAP